MDEAGSESGLSFIVRAQVDGGRRQRDAAESQFCAGYGEVSRLPWDVAGADVPDRVGSGGHGSVHGCGLEKQLVAPPDANFDHANFYWRMELQPEAAATLHSANSIGNDALQMTENRYRGHDRADYAGPRRRARSGRLPQIRRLR